MKDDDENKDNNQRKALKERPVKVEMLFHPNFRKNMVYLSHRADATKKSTQWREEY
ncbi:MAG: hypothetical protein OHK0040_04370 [bacterium]